MDRWARREREREIAAHQRERAQRLAAIEVLRSTTEYQPTYRDYVTYHCYMVVQGKVPLEWDQWRGDDKGD